MTEAWIAAAAVAWVGHACIWTASLNYLYGNPLPKWFLRPYRLFCGLAIAAFPLVVWALVQFRGPPVILGYLAVCGVFGFVVFPAITVFRNTRSRPKCVAAEKSTVVDLWPDLGATAVGDGFYPWAARLPFTGAFRVDFTDLTLALPNLPPEWDGLTVLLVTDTHFHGTPSKAWFDRVVDHVLAGPTPDLVVLGGDYLDSDRHREWVAPLFGRLKWKEAGVAVVGNHDEHHDPDATRKELAAAGFTVLSNRWELVTIRGVKCVVVGHEGPWFGPPPDLRAAPADGFRLCVSHSPDNFFWGVRNRIDLMLCGHVHGGQIRLPVVGPIFVPSVFGRRFDSGVFAAGRTVMVASRGLSGKEPLRFRCDPQVVRLTLTRSSPVTSSGSP